MIVNCDITAPRAIKISEGYIIPYIPSPTYKTMTLIAKEVISVYYIVYTRSISLWKFEKIDVVIIKDTTILQTISLHFHWQICSVNETVYTVSTLSFVISR